MNNILVNGDLQKFHVVKKQNNLHEIINAIFHKKF